MNDSLPNSTILPFDSLLERLRSSGFEIGVEQHLRLRTLLNRLPSEYAPFELKTLLCPLFASDAEQQAEFYRIFEQLYPLLDGRPEKEECEKEILEAVPPQTAGAPAIRRWPYLLASILLAAALVVFLKWKTERPRTPIVQSAPQSTSNQARSPEQRVGAGIPAPEIATPVSKQQFYSRYDRIVLWLGAVTICLLLWLSFEYFRFRRLRLLIQKARGKTPPYSWPIETGAVPEVFDVTELANIAQRLHRRYQTDTEHLDIDATVRASVEALGFPTFRHRKSSCLPEYLLLIDRNCYRDHQARLYEHLGAILREQGLYLSIAFFEGDPRICWSGNGDESISIEDLHRAHASSRLLLFGTGEQLLDAVTGRLVGWHNILTRWSERAILTPEDSANWGLREMVLASQFTILPATLDGLSALAAYFDLHSPPDPPSRMVQSDFRDVGFSAEAIERYLGPGVFRWLCVCAIYPELQWELTLRLGTLPSMEIGLVCEANLTRLLRLSWFREGTIPDEVRSVLIARLDQATAREARDFIVELLERSPAPADTFAASTRRFQIAYQRHMGTPENGRLHRELRAALEAIGPQSDDVYLHAAESVSRSPLDFLVPKTLGKLLYPSGVSWLPQLISTLSLPHTKKRHLATCAAIVLFSAITPTLFRDIRFFQILNLKALDTHFVVRGKMPTPDVFLVMADQKALDTYPELRIFWHKYYAEAIRVAAEGGAKAIALDATFAIPIDKWEPGLDQKIAETVASSPVPVVCANIIRLNGNQEAQQVPLNLLAAGLGLSGFANLSTDPDDVIRRQELIETASTNPNDPPPTHSLAMLLAEKYVGAEATFQNGKMLLKGVPIPIGKEHDITINYAGPPSTVPRASIVDFIDASRKGNKEQIQSWVKGKAVIVGVDFQDDRYGTPFFTFLGGASQWNMAGAEIHANTLETIINRAYLLPVPEMVRNGSLLAAAAVAVMIVTELSPGLAVAGMLLEVAAILFGTQWLFRQGRILSTSEILVAMAISLLGAIILNCTAVLLRR